MSARVAVMDYRHSCEMDGKEGTKKGGGAEEK
jgi:hypothetical protein